MKRLLLLPVIAVGSVFGQPNMDIVRRDLERIHLQGTRSVAEFRSQLQPMLSPSQRTIERSIHYTVVASGFVNGFAYIDDDGERRIDIGAGELQAFEFLSVAMLMPRWGRRECAVQYLSHIIDGVIENGRNHALGADLTPVYEPFAFARRNSDVCGGITYERMRADRDAVQLQPAILGASIRWLLAHEVGHHIYRHAGHKAPSLEVSREQEAEADAFAFKVCSQDDPTSIVLAYPAYLLMAGLGGSVENESLSTHPAGARRLVVLANALRDLPDNDRDFHDYLVKEGALGRWDDAVRKLETEVSTLLGK